MNNADSSSILERLSALGDETRTRILALLDGSEFTVSELCAVLQTPQPTVSRHLKMLALEGWVQARTEGRKRHYHLSPQLDDSTRSLWRIVHNEVSESSLYRADAERAQPVLDERRMRATAFFSESAAEWDRARAELFGSATGLGPLLGLIDPTWVVGDLGCGTGALTARVTPFARRTIGVDRSAAMLSTAQARLSEMDTAELRCGELESLPIEDEELELAILALVLHYIVDPRAVLSEVMRTLAPGGRVL
ncbi:MAG TPA: ArsR family transcriptional regulator, partial [Gemmatimonadetes bacterium]|nr:ArsR family transcriptional regulator [Gemmatimonadota bacterium]